MVTTDDVKRQASEWQSRRDQLQHEHEIVVRGLHRLMNFKIEFQQEKHRINHYMTGHGTNEWDSSSDPLVVEFTAHEGRVEKVFQLVYSDLKDFLATVYEKEPSETSSAETVTEEHTVSDNELEVEPMIQSDDIGTNASQLVAERLKLQSLLNDDYAKLEVVMKRLDSHRQALERNKAEFSSLNNQFCQREAELGAKIDHTISMRPTSNLTKVDSDTTLGGTPKRKWYRR